MDGQARIVDAAVNMADSEISKNFKAWQNLANTALTYNFIVEKNI